VFRGTFLIFSTWLLQSLFFFASIQTSSSTSRNLCQICFTWPAVQIWAQSSDYFGLPIMAAHAQLVNECVLFRAETLSICELRACFTYPILVKIFSRRLLKKEMLNNRVRLGKWFYAVCFLQLSSTNTLVV
jgi:hypothetical protein